LPILLLVDEDQGLEETGWPLSESDLLPLGRFTLRGNCPLLYGLTVLALTFLSEHDEHPLSMSLRALKKGGVPESRPNQVWAALDLRHGEVLILYVKIESHACPLVNIFLYAPGDDKSARPTDN